MSKTLGINHHDRDSAGLRYVYPVISRRSGGLSIGINFNPNNACNWRCIYCQVPNLQRGHAPEMDFVLLADELRYFLDFVQHGDFYDQFNIAPEQRAIKDIAISGNGEPTSLKEFARAIQLLGEIATGTGVFPDSHFVLITNGSLIHKAEVQAGLKALAGFGGEIWFKLDSATIKGRRLINNSAQSQRQMLENLKIATELCTTKLQTCMLHYQNQAWSEPEKQAYLQFLQELKDRKIHIAKIMLYSIARQSFQPEADDLEKVEINEMEAFAADIKALGYDVSVSV